MQVWFRMLGLIRIEIEGDSLVWVRKKAKISIEPVWFRHIQLDRC